jgi:hypothetical protein
MAGFDLNVLIRIGILAMLICMFTPKRISAEGFKSKCFSCEAQDMANGLPMREYGTKCFSCERQWGSQYHNILYYPLIQS